VLLQGIVPNTPVLKNLTASSLVYLNSGTLKAVVPNQEPSMAATLVREWAGVTPAVHVKGDNNPEVRGVLDTIDVRRILDFCRDLGNEQRRRIRVRDLLFEKMGILRKDQTGQKTVEWRGRKWRVGAVYDNTRQANENVFRPGEDEDLRAVVDYPFDELGHGPREDEQRIAEVVDGLSGKEAERGLPTVVWLPSFVDEDTRQALADLVTLDGLVDLKDADLGSRIPWISMDELGRVRSTLEQQRDRKLAQVGNALESAYGVNVAFEAHLAPGLAPERHAHLIRRGAKLTVPADGLFAQAFDALIRQALEVRAPRHPVLGKQPTRDRLEKVLDLLDRLLDTPERKAKFDKAQVEELRAVAAAQYFEIVRVIEDDVIFAGGIFDQVSRNLANHKGPLSVGAVRAALDPDGMMELSTELGDFLVLAYAKAATRPLRLFSHDRAVEGLIGKLRDDLALVPVELPGQEVWQRALLTAELLGVAPGGKALTPARVDELATLVGSKAAKLGAKQLEEAIAALSEWQELAGVGTARAATQRGEVLGAILDLIGVVGAAEGSKGIVDALARFAWEKGRATAIVHMTSADAVAALLDTLRSNTLKTPIALGRNLEADPARGAQATSVMDRVRAALVRDENVEPLRKALEREVPRITQMLVVEPPPPPPPPPGPEPALLGTQVDHHVTPFERRPPPVRTEHTLTRPADVNDVIAAIDAKLAEGKRVRVTIEILDGDGE